MHNTDKIPNGWAKAKISDLFDFIGGGTPSKNEFRFWNGEIPWASVKDIKGSYLTSTQDSITEIGLANSAANIANPGEVILITRISPGKVITTKIKTAVNQDLKIVRPKYDANPDFIRYLFNTLEKECIKLSSGTTVLGITLDVLNDIDIIIPPLNEQNRIVDKLDELLSELEKGKEQLQTSLEQLKVYKQSILKHAFEGKLTNENVKEGELPKSWSIKLVSDLCDVVRGGSPRPAGDPRYYGGNIPFLKVADLTKDDKVYVSTYEYTIKEAGLKKTRQIKPNTLLLTNSGATLGVPKISKIDATMNDGIAAFLNLDERSIHYMYYFWRSKTKELRGLNQGAAQPNLNTDIIKNYKVPYCSFEEQQLIVDAIESRFSESEKLEEEILSSILKLDSLRSSILQKAFEGKLVEQDPKDEPASVLLERIRKEREEYLKAENERKKTEKPLHIKSRKMAEELKRIMEILKESKEPVSAKILWQLSTHKDDIDDFYAALKKHIEAGEIIELPRKGKESFLKLVDAK